MYAIRSYYASQPSMSPRSTGPTSLTAVEGGRVWAFGHPFLRAGRGQLPMTSVEIVTTVPSDFNSFKLGNTGATIGVFDEDRFSGIAGWLA